MDNRIGTQLDGLDVLAMLTATHGKNSRLRLASGWGKGNRGFEVPLPVIT